LVRPGSSLDRLRDCEHAVRRYVFDGQIPPLANYLRDHGIQLVFHLASHFLVEHHPEDVGPLVASNVLLGTQLLEAMRLSECLLLINTGTFWQHFQDASEPVCLYAATKTAFEAIVRYYASAHTLRAITLKLFHSYGPDDPRPKLFSVFRRAALSDEPVDMSPGEQLIDLVHVDDVVSAYLVAAARLCEGAVSGWESYAVSSGNPLPLREVARIYEQATGVALNIRWGGRPYRSREVMVPWRGEVLPGWRPTISLACGLRP
ncbi:MAG: NAD-dependent epimerase/dehydratase family protein, partial [Pirellulaceae bacterium]